MVQPRFCAGQAASAFGFGFGVGVVAPGFVTGEPGAVGSGPVVTVTDGAFATVAVEITGTVAWVCPGPSGTSVVATAGPAELARVLFAISTTVVAAIVSRKNRPTGQIQSPGYQAKRRCQDEARTPTTPRFVGRRAPHSRQYSCSGS